MGVDEYLQVAAMVCRVSVRMACGIADGTPMPSLKYECLGSVA